MLASARRAVDIQHPASGPVVAAIANLSRHLHSAAWWCVECRRLSRPFLNALKSHSSSELVSHSTLLVSAPTRISPSPLLTTYYHLIVHSLSGSFFEHHHPKCKVLFLRFSFVYFFGEKCRYHFSVFKFLFRWVRGCYSHFSGLWRKKGRRNDSLICRRETIISTLKFRSWIWSECDFSS